MYGALKNHLYSWLFQHRGPVNGAIVLVQRRVFIVPTGQGFVFALVLLVMLTGSINYTLGLGFVLTFLLAALGVNAMIHTFRNLANLRVTAGRSNPVFAGDAAQFLVHLDNSGDNERHAIGLTRDKKHSSFVDVPARAITPAAIAGAGSDHGRGQEDFSGLRQYHIGDSPRHIAWKAAARDQGLLTKQFSGRTDTELWLDWRATPD